MWRSFYENPQEKEITDTFEVPFHSLAGDWSRGKERLRLAENDCSNSKEGSLNSRKRIWSCREASQYFEEQADFLGAEMDQARKNFGYETVKKRFEESFIEKGITNEFSN